MPRQSLTVCGLLAGLLLGGPAGAQSFAITGARIETAGPAGTLEQGTVLVRDGRIAAVGAAVTVPPGVPVVEARGRTVTPGLVLPSSNLTVAEIEQVASTRDDGAGPNLGAGFDPSAGVDTGTPMVQLARLNGVTTVVVVPESGRDGPGHHADDGDDATGAETHTDEPALFSGAVTGVSLGAGLAGPVIRTGAGIVLDMGEAGAAAAGGSRGAAFVLVRQALEDVRHFAANRAAYDRGEGRDLSLSRADLIALVPVVQGRVPLLVRVSRASDIRAVLAFAREQRIGLVLEGVEEGWRVAGEIAAAGVPVILDPEANLPHRFETLAATLENAALLERAGVRVAIMGSRGYNNLRQSRFNAGTAVAYGMPRPAALEAVTIRPARIWGLDREIGSIEPGKRADLVIWTGDPMEGLEYPVAVYVGGVAQPMQSRSTLLRDRYAPTPGDSRPPAYRY